MNLFSIQTTFRRLLFTILLLSVAAPLFASVSQYGVHTPTWLMKPPNEDETLTVYGEHIGPIDDSVTVTFSEGIEVIYGKTKFHVLDTNAAVEDDYFPIPENASNFIYIQDSLIVYRVKTMGRQEINVYKRSLLPDTTHIRDTIRDKKSNPLGKKTFTLYLYACPGQVTQYRTEFDREIAIMDSTAFPYVHTPIHRYAMWNYNFWQERRLCGQHSLLLNHSLAYVLYTLDLLNYDSLKFETLEYATQSNMTFEIEDLFFVFAPPRLDLVDSLVKIDFANDSLTDAQYKQMVSTVKRQMWELYVLDHDFNFYLYQKEKLSALYVSQDVRNRYHSSREHFLYDQVLERQAIIQDSTHH